MRVAAVAAVLVLAGMGSAPAASGAVAEDAATLRPGTSVTLTPTTATMRDTKAKTRARFSMIAAGGFAVCGITQNRPYCWGAGEANGTGRDQALPQPIYTGGVLRGKRLTAIAVDDHHACVLDSGGNAYCWGTGPLGDGSKKTSLRPVKVRIPASAPGGFDRIWTQVGSTICARAKADRQHYCWGTDTPGGDQYGRVPGPMKLSPSLQGVTLTDLQWRKTYLGLACAVVETGAVSCWNNYDTQDTSQRDPAFEVSGLPDPAVNPVIQLAAGYNVSCAVMRDGSGWCWTGLAGPTDPPPLGDGKVYWAQAADPFVAHKVKTASRLTKIAANDDAACALTVSQRVLCWGSGFSGKLGDGTLKSHYLPRPIKVSSSLRFVDIQNATAICALERGGTTWCWGFNGSGQLGRGSISLKEYPTPAPVLRG